MEIRGGTAGHNDFIAEGTNKAGLHLPKAFTDPEPRAVAVGPSVNMECSPRADRSVDCRLRVTARQTQRVAVKINGAGRDTEPIAEGTQRVAIVEA
jgi:hypothetical protein